MCSLTSRRRRRRASSAAAGWHEQPLWAGEFAWYAATQSLKCPGGRVNGPVNPVEEHCTQSTAAAKAGTFHVESHGRACRQLLLAPDAHLAGTLQGDR